MDNRIGQFLVLAFNQDFDKMVPIAGPHDFDEALVMAQHHKAHAPQQAVCIVPVMWVSEAAEEKPPFDPQAAVGKLEDAQMAVREGKLPPDRIIELIEDAAFVIATTDDLRDTFTWGLSDAAENTAEGRAAILAGNEGQDA